MSKASRECLGVVVSVLLSILLIENKASRAVVHHDLKVELFPKKHELQGHDTITVEGESISSLILHLAPQAQVHKVTVDGREGDVVFESGRLLVLGGNAARRRRIIDITYSVVCDDPVPENPLHTEDPTYGVTGTIAPEGTFLLSGAGWYPRILNATATFRLSVRGPAGYEAVTAGKRVKRELLPKHALSVWEIQNDLEGLSLSAGPYVVREERAGGIPVYTYFFPEDEPLSGRYLDATMQYIRLYTELFGPYPFEKFAVVENFFPTGYGFPSYTLLGRTVVRLPFIVETSLGHEVAHSWWGNGVLADHSEGNWSEGLTSYVADYLYKERSSSEEGRAHRLQILRDYASLVSPDNDFALTHFTRRASPSSAVIGYGKAAMVFHMARRLIGDGAFWKGLRSVYEERLFKRASWCDFATAFSESSKTDMAPFFDQWINRTGGPRLALEDITSTKTRSGWQINGRIRQARPYYDLQLPLRLETENGEVEAQIRLSGKSLAFSLLSDTPPKRLLVDPEADLFRHLESSEIPATTNSIKGSASLVAVASKDLSARTHEVSTLLLAALGHEKTKVFQEDQIDSRTLEGEDVLYLGLPRNHHNLGLPDGVSVARDRFRLEGESFDDRNDALFLVWTANRKDRAVAALFLPLSEKAAAKVIRKIPHYGKYSYLAFSDGVNLAKGTWPVKKSSLIHRFD
jgi:aminopeptidase N